MTAMPTDIHYGDLHVSTSTHEVRQGGRPVRLTGTEHRLLVFLLEHQGKVCPREDIIYNVWGESFLYDTGTLDVHLSSLRHKLGWTKEGPLRSVRGVGLILPQRTTASESVKIGNLLRELLLDHKDALQSRGIRCQLRLTPYVYEIAMDEAIARQIFSAVFSFFLKHAPDGALWDIASQLTIREYTLTLTSSGSCNDFAELATARSQAAFLGIAIRMGSKPSAQGSIMGVELAIPMESPES